MRVPEPPRLTSAAHADRLRADLAPFTVEAVEEALGPTASAALDRDQIAPAVRALRGDRRPAALLARLFLLGEHLPRADVEELFPALTPAGAAACGLIEPAGPGAFRAPLELSPTGMPAGEGPAFIAADLLEAVRGAALPPWHVLGVGGASRTLNALLPADVSGARVLDLGTGSGIQALTLAARGARVTATDVSARALAFARFNADLAGLTVDLRAGSLFEPVTGETFDLIVSNPPFVITPPAAYAAGMPVMTYRDSGTNSRGDALVAGLVRRVTDFLAPGGRALLLGNWEVTGDEEEFAAPRAWLAGTGAAAWVLRREFQDPAEYTEMWLRDGGLSPDRDPGAYAAAYEAYLEDFASRGVRWIDFGFFFLRADDGGQEFTNLTAPALPDGQTMWQLFDARRRLAAAPDEDIAAARIAAQPDVTLEHHFRVGASEPEVITATQGEGLGMTITCPTELAGLLSAADGTLTVDQIAGALAALLDADPAAMRAACIGHARRLAAIGMVHLITR